MMISNIYLQTTWSTSMEVDSKLYRIYFHNCLESEGEVEIKKMYFVSKFVAHLYTIWSSPILKLYTRIIINFEMK